MKTLIGSPFLLLLILLLVTLSCSDDENGGTKARTGMIIAKFADHINSFEAVGTALFYDGKIMINGVDDIWDISVILREQHGEGSYDVMGDYLNSTPKVEVNYTHLYSSLHFHEETIVGSVVLTEIDKVNKTISGRFTCKLAEYYGGTPKEITSGSFTKIPYKTAPIAVVTCQIDWEHLTANAFEVSTRDSLSSDGKIIRFISMDATMSNSKAIHMAFYMDPSAAQSTFWFENFNRDAWLSCDINSDNFRVGTTGEILVFNNQVLRNLDVAFYFDGENREKKLALLRVTFD